MNISIFSVFSLCLLIFSNSALGQIQTAPNRNFIFTEGTAEVAGQNDSARISIAVQTEKRDMGEAASENAEKTKAVIRAVEGLNIKGLKLKTTNYRVTPQKDFKARPPKTRGYEAHNTIEVTVEGFDSDILSSHASKILGKALENGANDIRTIQFYIRDKKPLEKEGLNQATQEAIERAKILAKSAGVKLKRIASISTQPIPSPLRPQVFRAQEMTDRVGGIEPPIESGESKIIVRISIAYEIE